MFKKNYKRIIMQRVRRYPYVILYPIFQLFVKQRNNEILFLSDSRTDLTGNFGCVYNEIKKRDKYIVRSVLKDKLKTKKTLKEKFGLIYYLARSKYVFVDDFYPIIYAIPLSKKKELIQLWHAMGAFKTVGYARMGKPGGPNGYSLSHRNYTGTIVSSESIRDNYALAFGIDKEKVHALGIPRTDIFFDKKYENDIKEKIYTKYPVLKDKKVIMFAPTFRGPSQNNAYYDFDWIDFEKLKKEFSKDYVCIVKMHPFVQNKPDYDLDNDDFYLDLTSEREINDLLFITDILITDYSSVIFEYSFFKKPVIFYTPDYDDYVASRDFFYDFDKYNYGAKATNMKELVKYIKECKADKEKIKEFYDYFCSACDGKSTKRVVDYFLGGDNGENNN